MYVPLIQVEEHLRVADGDKAGEAGHTWLHEERRAAGGQAPDRRAGMSADLPALSLAVLPCPAWVFTTFSYLHLCMLGDRTTIQHWDGADLFH